MNWGRFTFDTILVVALVVISLVTVLHGDKTPTRLDCSALCAPRAVLPGVAGVCACAPDASWITGGIETCDKACAGLPFDVSVAADGAIECSCGRPEKIRATWRKGG